MIQIVTWNDFGESTNVEPVTSQYGDRGTGLYDLTGYYATWFQTGSQPTITRDVLYYFYRKEPTTAAAPAQSQPMTMPFPQTPQNQIELLAFLTAPGTLSITINGQTTTQAAPAGVTSFKVPTAPGIPQFALTRNDVPVIQFQGKTQIYGAAGLPTGVLDLTYWSDSASIVNSIPNLTAAGSRKSQGGAFDINLPLTGAAAVECRYGAMTNGYQLILTFDQSIASGTAAVTGGTGNVSSTVISGTTMTLTLSGVTNQQTLTVAVNDATNASGQSLASTAVKMRILHGDVNGDGVVNAVDLSGIRNAYGKSAGQAGFDPRSDLNVDGIVNSLDTSLIRANYGKQVP
jgi:hypothetical protein